MKHRIPRKRKIAHVLNKLKPDDLERVRQFDEWLATKPKLLPLPRVARDVRDDSAEQAAKRDRRLGVNDEAIDFARRYGPRK